MALISKIYRSYSFRRLNLLDKIRKDPASFQHKWFKTIIENGALTGFGKEHKITRETTLHQFSKNIPIRSYEKIVPWIDRAKLGETSVLWPGKTRWFAKSSGTSTSKSKFIPVTYSSLRECHYNGMLNMISTYLYNNPKSKLLDGRALTLGGSAGYDKNSNRDIQFGDLSAILLKNSPFLAELIRTPPADIALLSDFETKVKEICKISTKQNVTSISGVPSWNLILLNAILDYTGKKDLRDVWPNLELFMHGGVNFSPYRSEYNRIIPHEGMNYSENYNASEGYFAFQDQPNDDSMLLMTNGGVFYEFIPMDKYAMAINGEYQQLETIESVKKGVNYAMVITTNGGLWRYLIGDSIMFTSLKPHKIVITGRTHLFINAFGEELMISNTEAALAKSCDEHNCSVEEYTVAPLFMELGNKGRHQWLVEFKVAPANIEAFADTLDREICNLNSDYEAKRSNDITMTRLSLLSLPKGAFYQWLKDRGKLGGQNKVPRLSNNRVIVDELLNYYTK